MSWGAYVDSLTKMGPKSKAAVVGLEGSVWAQSDGLNVSILVNRLNSALLHVVHDTIYSHGGTKRYEYLLIIMTLFSQNYTMIYI